MLKLVRQIRGTLNLNDLLLIMSIALFLPLRLAFPLTAQIVSGRIINTYLTFGDQDAGSSGTRPIPIPS
jgi:hypothetical protein